MKILLINSPTNGQRVVRDMAGGLGFDGGQTVVLPPLELAYMAATLLNKGHEAEIIDANVEIFSAQDVYRFIVQYRPDTIIVTVSLPSIYLDCAFIKEIPKNTISKIIVKTNINYPPILNEILKASSAEICIYGECETNIDKIITGEEALGTAYFRNGELKVEENNFIKDLDELPLPARNLLPNDKYRYALLGERVTTMQTSRGCPFPCSYYCPYPLVQGKPLRSRSTQHVIREIEDIAKNYKIRKILFRDAAFTLDKSRVEKICDLIIANKIDIDWWCETRVDCLEQEIMVKMKEAGCKGINIGVETGDPEVLQTQAKIGLTLDKLKSVRIAAQRIKMKLHFLLLIGLPSETKKSLYETFRLIRELRPESMGICIVTPYPGTPLYDEAKKHGWIETEDWSKYGGHTPVMHTDNLSSVDMSKAQRMLSRGFHILSNKNLTSWFESLILNFSFKNWSKY